MAKTTEGKKVKLKVQFTEGHSKRYTKAIAEMYNKRRRNQHNKDEDSKK